MHSTKGCPIIHDKDQDTTDLQKSLAWIFSKVSQESCTVYVLGALGGRFDHSMAAIHTLYLYPSLKMYLLSAESMAFLLTPGLRHEIIVQRDVLGPTCGLLPIGAENVVMETKGLKWELDQSSPLQFGGLVSSSNAFAVAAGPSSAYHTITASTNKPVIFTIEIDLSRL
jgi:thiamine pyrophosphokinase